MHSITIDFPGQGISALWFARMPPTDQTQCYVFGDFISTRFPLYSFGYRSIKCQSYCGLIQTKLYDFDCRRFWYQSLVDSVVVDIL